MGEHQQKHNRGDSGSITILVIEPQVLVRMIIADYLRSCGYRVIEGATAQDAFTVVHSDETVSIILAEAGLSGDMDGLSLSKQLKATHPNIDVILTNNVANAAEKAGDLCDQGPLEKPYHPQEILRRIDSLRARH